MISVYAADATDFSTVGLAALEPISATVNEIRNGAFTLELEHPIDDADKWTLLQPHRIIKCPAPMRETPLIQIIGRQNTGSGGGTVTRSVYRVSVSSRLRLRTGPGTSYDIIGRYSNGTTVKELESSGGWKHVVVLWNGAEGWMSSDYLVYDHDVQDTIDAASATTETIDVTVQPVQTRDQLFRIKSVSVDAAGMTVKCECDHVSYDLVGSIVTTEIDVTDENAVTFFNTLIANVSKIHTSATSANLIAPFNIINAITTGKITGKYTGESLINALLDPDIGFASQTNAMVIRDNFNIYILPDIVHDRGVEIRHRKNLLGATLKTDYSDVVTRIRPIGSDGDGNRVMPDSNGGFVDSTHINDYPCIYAQEISYGLSVGDDIPDVATLKTKLIEKANEDFSNGADLPQIELDVDFVALESVPEYAAYKALEAVHLFDSVRVVSPNANIDAKLRVNEYEYSPLTRQYTGVTLGDITDFTQTVYGFQIPSATVDGSKIIPATVGDTELRTASIKYAKIEQATINKLSADSITALTAKINALTAGTIETDTLSAAVAHMVNLIADKVSAGTITTGTITAAMAELEVLICGTATFDAATVRHLVSEALNVTNTVSGDAFISNLRVAYAQMVSATIGDLCIKASDGNYYLIDVNSNGTVTATQTTVTQQEIAQGHTNAGDVIVASDITAASLSTSDIFATYALVNKIDAARIDVDQLYAREAFIDRLNTTDIRSNSYIQMMVGEAQREASQWRVIVTSTDADCVLIGTGSTTLSARVYYGAEDMTDSISASMFSWVRSSGNATADATWNTNHSGMKSVTVTAGEASYNAVYSCNVDNGGITAVLGTGTLGTMMLGIGA